MVRKVHTRKIRYMPVRKGRIRKSRPKSFASEEAAKAWAANQGIKDYTIKNLRNTESKTKKLVVVPK